MNAKELKAETARQRAKAAAAEARLAKLHDERLKAAVISVFIELGADASTARAVFNDLKAEGAVRYDPDLGPIFAFHGRELEVDADSAKAYLATDADLRDLVTQPREAEPADKKRVGSAADVLSTARHLQTGGTGGTVARRVAAARGTSKPVPAALIIRNALGTGSKSPADQGDGDADLGRGSGAGGRKS